MDLKNKIKIVGLDLDGTLLSEDKKIKKETLFALNEAIKRNIEIVPVTGRPFSGIPKEVLEIENLRYVITSNGANIFDLQESKKIYSQTIENKLSLSLIEKMKEENCIYEVFANGVGYIETPFYNRQINNFKKTPLEAYIRKSRKPIENIYRFVFEEKIDTDEISIVANDRLQREEIFEKVKEIKEVTACPLGDVYLEITSKSANKGETFLKISNMLNIPKESTMAFGDGMNDFSLLSSAGISVAMENGNNDLKRIADIVTSSNEENGVGKILNIL